MKLRIMDALESAMQQAEEKGEDYRIEDFIDELVAVKIGDSFKITTDSGNTDFSTPPFPMLPKLLKNAKIAQDGSQYKVIPLKQKGTVGLTTESALGDLNRARREMRSVRGHKNRDPSDKGETFMDMYTKQRSTHKTAKQRQAVHSRVDFRTVSSKQDPNTSWVHPGKNANMGDTLRKINDELQQEVHEIIQSIVEEYERIL